MSELKRGLEDADPTVPVTVEASATGEPPAKKQRIKNRKFALLLCYDGQNYFGLQRNEPLKTIEGELLKALLKLDLITQEKYDKPQLINFQRAARTDKGVSALRQILSATFPENFPEHIEQINAELPEEIRLLSAKRTVPSFCSRNFVDFRTYSYTFPTFAISPPKTNLSTYWRVQQPLIDQCNELLAVYKGTHNFHNFTSGKSPNENSSMRYIMDISCSAPFEYEEMEFAKITVRGQSFMLHQIRKMIGLVFAIMRGYGDKSKIELCFLKEKQDVPIAPGLGLLLEQVHYDTYNRKYTGDGSREPLLWEECNEQIDEFRRKHIFNNLYQKEKQTFSMITWLDTLRKHSAFIVSKEQRSAEEGDKPDDQTANEAAANEEVANEVAANEVAANEAATTNASDEQLNKDQSPCTDEPLTKDEQPATGESPIKDEPLTKDEQPATGKSPIKDEPLSNGKSSTKDEPNGAIAVEQAGSKLGVKEEPAENGIPAESEDVKLRN